MTKTYFSHDSNARNSKKLLRLRKKHGAAGYGVYFMLLERLTEEENYCSDLDYDMLAFDLHVKKELLKSVIENFRLFDVQEDGNGTRRFQSAGLLERMEIRKMRSAAGKKGMEIRWNNSPQLFESEIEAQADTSTGNNKTDNKTITKNDFVNSKRGTIKGGVNINITPSKKNNIYTPFFYSFPTFENTEHKATDLAVLSYLVLERNMYMAEKELEKLIAYNTLQGSSRKSSWEEMTVDQRMAAAKLWTPFKDQPRNTISYLVFWRKLIEAASELKADWSIIYWMLSDEAAASEGCKNGKTYILHVRNDVCDWLEEHIDRVKPIILEYLKLNNCNKLEYDVQQ